MKKIFFISFMTTLFVWRLQAQALEHTQGEILLQVRDYNDLKKIIAGISPLKRSNAVATAHALSPEQIWYRISFDYTRFNENDVLDKVRADHRTVAAQFNHFISMRRNPNDPEFSTQWEWLNDGLNGKTKGIDTKAGLAWYKTTGGKTKQGKEIVIAIIDDGTESSHPDLSANTWVNKNEIPLNGLDDDGNGYIDDYSGWNVLNGNDSVEGGEHGVSVNGLIGARGNNGIGVTGANWNIKLMNLKYDVRNGITEADVITGYSYILRQRKLYNSTGGSKGAFIVASNASWGIDNGKAADAPLWCSIYDSLGQAGILNVSAAANSTSVNVDTLGDLPSLCPSNFLIPVTSIGSDGKRYGAFGPVNIDIAAPGERIYTTRPFGKYGSDAGTSFAAPIVTGAIGLLYSNACTQLDNLSINNPPAAALLVRQAILKSVDTSGILKNAVSSGGFLNMLNALNMIQQSCAACVSAGLSTRMYIDSLVLDGLRFRSKDNGGYGDFTNVDSLMPMINSDGQILLKVYPKAKDSLSLYMVRVWIDRNMDNDFNDTAELVWDSGSKLISGTLVNNIYLPPAKIDSLGRTTIRIALKVPVSIADLAPPTPCDFFNAGEVEDYTIKFLPKTFNCPDVLELDTMAVTDNSATIFFQKIRPKLFYFIRYRNIATNKWDTLPGRDTMFMLTQLDACTTYKVESKTFCDSDTSKWNTMLVFRTKGCTTVVNRENIIAIDKMNAYPNPFTELVHVQFNTTTTLPDSRMRLVSINGSLLQEQTLGNLSTGTHNIDLYPPSGIPAGMYFVQIISPKGGVTRKLAKLN